MLVYLVVINDIYELPVYCGDTHEEIAEIFGSTVSYVTRCVNEGLVFKNEYLIKRVELDDE